MGIDVSKALVLSAAAGMLSGLTATACGGAPEAAPADPSDKIPDASGDKECCAAGQNECKGQGNCKTESNDCAKKNECRGQGGCQPQDCKG